MSLFDSASLVVTPNGYKAGKLYSIKPTSGAGDLDVVRATSATRVNASGLIEVVGNNIPRLDYTNGSCPSILVEPQRTNLLLRSEEFNNAYWTKSSTTVTANDAVAPSGTMTADKLVDNNIFSGHDVRRSIAMTSGISYTFSVFAKIGEIRWVVLRYVSGGAFSTNHIVFFDLQNGTAFNSPSFPSTGFSIISIGNGWYRCSITQAATSTDNGIASIFLSINGTGTTYAGNGTDGIFIWGAQLEAGSNATSYIPTQGSTVTRNADVISKSGLSGITTITETFENNTTNVISGSPTSYTMSQGRIKQVIGV